MNEIEVSSIDLVEGGNVFKQGHYLTLGYIPRDETGALVDLTGKTLSVTLWGRKGIGFEADAVYADGVLRFTLNETIPAGEYNVEFTVTSSTDATYRKKFPTSASSGRIVVRQSADDLGAIGVQVITVAQLKAEQQALQTSFEQTVDGKIVELETTVTEGIGAFTEDTEVINARQGKATLGENLNGITAQLADTNDFVVDTQNLVNYEINSNARNKKAIISFVTDDARVQDYTICKDLFTVPWGTGVITGSIGQSGYMDLAQLTELANQHLSGKPKVELLSHTHTHPRLGDSTDAVIEYELSESKKWLLANGFEVYNLAYPYGSKDDRVKRIARKYYRSARTSFREMPNEPPVEQFELKTVWMNEETGVDAESGFAKNTFEHYKYYIDKAKANDSWLILSFHSWNISTHQAVITQTINYINSVGVPVKTVNDALNEYGNIVESGMFEKDLPEKPHFAIGMDGTVHANGVMPLLLTADQVDFATPVSSFKFPYETISRITNSNPTIAQFPGGKVGMLSTFRFASTLVYGYQKYTTITGLQYIRQVNSDGTWGKFTPLVAIETDYNLVSAATPMTDYPLGITYSKVGSNNAVGMPLGKGGMLITNKPNTLDSENRGWSFQEYHIYESAEIYKRSYKADGTWGIWYLLNSMTEKLPDNGVTATTAITGYPNNKITICKITTANATGFPNNTGGVLTTNKIVNEHGFMWQEYQLYNSFDVYKRYVTATGTYSAWQKFQMTV